MRVERRVGGLLRGFPSVGPPPVCLRRSNAGLSDTILSGLNGRGKPMGNAECGVRSGCERVPARRAGQTSRPRCLFSPVVRYAGWLTQAPRQIACAVHNTHRVQSVLIVPIVNEVRCWMLDVQGFKALKLPFGEFSPRPSPPKVKGGEGDRVVGWSQCADAPGRVNRGSRALT